MNKLTTEQAEALHQNGDQMQIVDPTTDRVYVVVDPSILERAKAVLQQQQEEDLAAIQQGVADMEAGRTVPAEEAHERVRQQLRSQYGA